VLGRAVGTVEVVDTGRRAVIRDLDDLVDLLRQVGAVGTVGTVSP